MKINFGDKAPDFMLPSQMGDNVTLSEYFGKRTSSCTFTPRMKPVAARVNPANSGIGTMFSQAWARKCLA
jgi:hypothetical protein